MHAASGKPRQLRVTRTLRPQYPYKQCLDQSNTYKQDLMHKNGRAAGKHPDLHKPVLHQYLAIIKG
jgi:hypothetical protein